MSKKKAVDSRLTMHKLLGDHTMVNAALCKECGIQEGEKIVETYKPLTIGQEQVEELVHAIMSLAERVRNLETQLTIAVRNNPYPKGLGHYVGGAGVTKGGGVNDYYQTWQLGTHDNTAKMPAVTYSSSTGTKSASNNDARKDLMHKLLETRSHEKTYKEAWQELKPTK